jgi:hypothetical protein
MVEALSILHDFTAPFIHRKVQNDTGQHLVALLSSYRYTAQHGACSMFRALRFWSWRCQRRRCARDDVVNSVMCTMTPPKWM